MFFRDKILYDCHYKCYDSPPNPYTIEEQLADILESLEENDYMITVVSPCLHANIGDCCMRTLCTCENRSGWKFKITPEQIIILPEDEYRKIAPKV